VKTEIHDTTQARVRTLAAIVDDAATGAAVRREDLGWGDRLVVTTRNSVYSIWALGADEYLVCGGWFDRKDMSPALVTINGCTYGGSAIRHDVIAAPGLFLEFGNNVLTTRIRHVRVVRRAGPPERELSH
jgi:hypothetical protein